MLTQNTSGHSFSNPSHPTTAPQLFKMSWSGCEVPVTSIGKAVTTDATISPINYVVALSWFLHFPLLLHDALSLVLTSTCLVGICQRRWILFYPKSLVGTDNISKVQQSKR